MSRECVQLVPLHLHHNGLDLERFLSPLYQFWDDREEVAIDLTSCRFLDAEGAALLAAFATHRQSWGGETRIEWSTVSDGVKKQLGRWRLTNLFGLPDYPWTDNAIPLLRQKQLDSKGAYEYICTVLREGENMPSMTRHLVDETVESFLEIFVNIFEHAESTCGALAIGQFFPNKKHVQFCVCDRGVGLANRVRLENRDCGTDALAINWALGRGHTTKILSQ